MVCDLNRLQGNESTIMAVESPILKSTTSHLATGEWTQLAKLSPYRLFASSVHLLLVLIQDVQAFKALDW